MFTQIKNNKLPIKTVSRLLGIKLATVYKHCQRQHYRKDERTDSIIANTFIDYVMKQGKYHQKRYEFYLKLYQGLIVER